MTAHLSNVSNFGASQSPAHFPHLRLLWRDDLRVVRGPHRGGPASREKKREFKLRLLQTEMPHISEFRTENY